MKTQRFGRNLFFSLCLAALAAPALHAQQQPAAAGNQQDEVVTIPLEPGAGEQDVLRILRSNDKLETNRYVTRAFELFNTNAYELRPFIVDAAQTEDGQVRSIVTKPLDAPSRHFIVVTTTPEQMPTIADTIQMLDVDGLVNTQGSTRKAVRVKYRRASDLGNILRATRLTAQARVVADDQTNTLYYDDSDYVMKAVEEYLQFFDVPVPQVEFDVQIVEVREEDSGKVGLDWDAWKRDIGGQFGFVGNLFEGNERYGRVDALLTLDAVALANFLNYTVQHGNARLLHRSRINASNLEPAIISDVRRVPSYEYAVETRAPEVVQETNPPTEHTVNDDGTPAEDITHTVVIVPPSTRRLRDLGEDQEGMLIQISPTIGTETVTATIDIALNTITAFDQQGRPLVTQQNLSNLFTLQDGKTILLGTLERQTAVKSRSGIPGLKDIPVIKYFFSVSTSQTRDSWVFLLAKPRFSNVRYNAPSLERQAADGTLRIEDRNVDMYDGEACQPEEIEPPQE